MNILVTGGAGFIGSHLVDALVKKGHTVKVLDNFFNGNIANLVDSVPDIRITEADVRDLDVCRDASYGQDAIFHQAARGSVPLSIESPGVTMRDNVLGFHNILHAAVENKVKRVIYASSSSVHGDEEGNIISPYALSKKVNEQYADVFGRVYGLETVGLRYFNVFGPRQRLDSVYGGVVPIFIDAFRNGYPVKINGDGEQRRDFTYVSNVVDANLKAIETSGTGMVYDIGCGEPVSVNELYRCLKSLHAGNRGDYHSDKGVIYSPGRNGDIEYSCADTKPAFVNMYFKASVGFKEGLHKTWAQWQPSSKCLTG